MLFFTYLKSLTLNSRVVIWLFSCVMKWDGGSLDQIIFIALQLCIIWLPPNPIKPANLSLLIRIRNKAEFLQVASEGSQRWNHLQSCLSIILLLAEVWGFGNLREIASHHSCVRHLYPFHQLGQDASFSLLKAMWSAALALSLFT